MVRKINVKLILELRNNGMGRNAIARTRHISVNSVGDAFHHEGGRPADFLDVYRKEEEIRRVLASRTYEEGSKYLLEKYGIDRD